MNWFYRHFIRPVLFAQDPEAIHRFTINMLAYASRYEWMCDAMESYLGSPALPSRVFGLDFPNPIGLAAGMDKDGEATPVWAAMGFGHCELGAVTWQAQPGNPVPRIFRIVQDEAVINRMGFNNIGAAALAAVLQEWQHKHRWPKHPVAINLGKTKITPLEKAPEDYAQSLDVLWPYADFFVINVSSPNTPNLRELQNKKALEEILAALNEVNQKHANLATQKKAGLAHHDHGTPAAKSYKPILVKVAPDLSFEALDEILGLVMERQVAGLVATNTTITRPQSDNPDIARIYQEMGGLSGKPLRARSTEIIRHLYKQSQGKIPIMGVGGIFTADDAWEKIAAGASLLQIYTSLVYEGPGVVKKIVTGLKEKLGQHGMKELSEAVGCETR